MSQQICRLIGVVMHPPHLLRTGLLALLVGTWLTLINLADVLFLSPLNNALMLKVATNYLTPFVVANLGLLSRR